MGIELLTEAEYHELQKLGEFGTTTSSWVQTRADMRVLGGASFGDRRYGKVFTYQTGRTRIERRGGQGVLRV